MKTLHLTAIIVPMFFTLFVTSQAYAPCIEGPGINCNNYPPQTLSQIHFDKLNYETQDKPVITISGVPSTAVHLEIDDSSSNIVFEHDLNLLSNGTARYVLDISYYKIGGYSATATSLMSKVTTGFTVGMTPSGGNMNLSVDKNSYLPGDKVSILGTGNSNTMIQLSLVDPFGTSIRSTKTFSDKTGHFSSSNFTIPNNAVSGIWKIGATGGVMHVQTQFAVNSTNNPSGIKTDKTITSSPLKQFKSGIKVEDVQCYNGLSLVIKKEDGSPACVKPDTASTLIYHGWASSVFGISFEGGRTFVIPDILAAYVPCTTKYLQSDTDVTVLYMPANSIGKICLRYSNINDTPETISAIRIFDPNNSYQNVTSVKIWNNLENNYTIPKGDSNVIYWIQTGNQTGFYGMDLFCGGMPFAIGYGNNSNITSSDFPFLGITHSCPIMSYGVNIEGLTGIGVKYIPFHNDVK